MVYFIWDTFEVAVSESAIGRVLKRVGWNKKIVNRAFRHRFLTWFRCKKGPQNAIKNSEIIGLRINWLYTPQNNSFLWMNRLQMNIQLIVNVDEHLLKLFLTCIYLSSALNGSQFFLPILQKGLWIEKWVYWSRSMVKKLAIFAYLSFLPFLLRRVNALWICDLFHLLERDCQLDMNITLELLHRVLHKVFKSSPFHFIIHIKIEASSLIHTLHHHLCIARLILKSLFYLASCCFDSLDYIRMKCAIVELAKSRHLCICIYLRIVE